MMNLQLRQIEIPTKAGVISAPATNKIDEIPYLAVTMSNFGRFEVTHVPSGCRIVGGFERAVNAFVAMAEVQLALDELGIDLSQNNYDKLRADIIAKDKECKIIGMTFREWITLSVTIGAFGGEFPWESEDDSPYCRFEELMNKLKNTE